MTPEQLAQIQQRADAAQPGPWSVTRSPYRGGDDPTAQVNVSSEWFDIASDLEDEDAEFIAHARADIPALLAAVRDAQRRAEQAEQRAEIAEAVILDAALAEQAEDIAQAIRELPHGQTNSTPWVPDFDAGWRHGRMDCLATVQAIARNAGSRHTFTTGVRGGDHWYTAADETLTRVRELADQHWDWKAGLSLHAALRAALDGEATDAAGQVDEHRLWGQVDDAIATGDTDTINAALDDAVTAAFEAVGIDGEATDGD